jgi:predicted O-methyltransferase YrrM
MNNSTEWLDVIKMDDNHINLIYSLLINRKPKNVLELGIGSGKVTEQIINAFEYNGIPANLDCVDNFFDWNGVCPDHISDIKTANIIVSDEWEYISRCNKKYDFIVSDADHTNTDKWVIDTMNLLNIDGMVVYHDVTNPMFPNLYRIIQFADVNNLNYFVFNKSSRSDEKCERGLLVIQKSKFIIH